MSKVAIVYWSGTGNTEAMANAVKEGAGADAVLINCTDFDASQLDSYHAIAFGCPAMGDEVLEEMDFQPMFDGIVDSLSGRTIALFGSYGWGGGAWMRAWEKTCEEAGANLACESVICAEAPDDETLAACKAMGETLAK